MRALTLLLLAAWASPGLALQREEVIQSEGPQINGNGTVNFVDHVGIDQNLGDSLDLRLPFRDEAGRTVLLGEYFDDRPVVLVLAYYECPMLCTLVLNGMTKSLRTILDLDAGKDYEVVVVSIDPEETPELAAETKAN
ncbi:MAG: SCO family protein, partial [Planctomycetota bacterium]